MKKWIVIFLTVILFQAAFAGLQGAPAGAAPTETIKEIFDTVQKIKKEDKDKNIVLTSEEEKQNRELSLKMNRMLDIEGISAYALQDQWKKRSPKDRQAFVNLFTTLLEKVAYPNTSDFLGEVDFSVRNEKMIGEKAMVNTSIVHEDEGRIDIDFRLRLAGSSWVVEDVILDGVSLVRNIRTQSQKIIRDHSYEELLKRMKNKIEDEETGEIKFEDITGRD